MDVNKPGDILLEQHYVQTNTELIDNMAFYSNAKTTIVNMLQCVDCPDLNTTASCLATPTEEATIEIVDIPRGRWKVWEERIRKKKKS
jgi:hypothetical protein